MCELFGMSSRYPAVVTLSLGEFAQHGGNTGHHRDGWGIAFAEGPDARILREPTPAADSPLVRCVRDNGFASTCVIAHVRKATMGEVSLRNTQPFHRELGGYVHVFAHNGHVPLLAGPEPGRAQRYQPIGDTDSEVAFCVLLNRVARLWGECPGVPDLEARLDLVTAMATELRSHGPANFLYSDGDTLFVHGDRRTQADSSMGAPGLHMLTRSCPAPAVGGGISVHSDCEQEVILVASVPLTSEDWQPVPEGQVIAVVAGQVASTRHGPLERRESRA